MGICQRELAGGFYNLCPPWLSISPKMDDRNCSVNTTRQIMVSLDGCLRQCSTRSFKGASVGWEVSKSFNSKFQGNVDWMFTWSLDGKIKQEL